MPDRSYAEALSPSMREAIELAREDGGFVCAGQQVRRGRVVRVNARTLDALVKRGIARPCFSNDGGMAVELLD